MAKYTGKQDKSAILKKVNQSLNGISCGITGIPLEVAEVLSTFIEFSDEIAAIEYIGIITKALSSMCSKPLNDDEVIKAISAVERTYLQREVNEYTVITSISISKMNAPIKWKTNRCVITLNSKIPKNTQTIRDDLLKEKCLPSYLSPHHYANISVKVQARSAFKAAEIAFEELSFIRGMLNLYLNPSMFLDDPPAGTKRPYNEITLGPTHTIHKKDGNLATETFWCEFDYIERDAYDAGNTNFGKAIEFSRKIIKRCKKSKYEAKIKEGISRYCNALDSLDAQVSFQKLWSVAEFLTDSSMQNNEIAIKRIASLYKEKDYTAAVLNHIRVTRNRCIHAGFNPENMYSIMNRLRAIIEDLIIFIIRNITIFKKYDDIIYFFEAAHLPVNEIERRLYITKKVLAIKNSST